MRKEERDMRKQKKHPDSTDLIQAQNVFKNLIYSLGGEDLYESRSKSI